MDLKHLIDISNKIVVFSGAGFSTESNIPDFRSDSGIYNNKKYPYPCETMLSHSFYKSNPTLFYEFYKNEMIYENAMPNKGHLALAKLEEQGKLEAIITQNIDGLHQKAGNTKVFELHGSVHRNYCEICHTFYDLNTIVTSDGVPHCSRCGGIIKPDVVLYEEGLDDATIHGAIKSLMNADLLIVAGTSLTVYPAAGLLRYYKGEHLVLINHDITYADAYATIVHRENIGDVLSFILDK